jgi:hypothetical protein
VTLQRPEETAAAEAAITDAAAEAEANEPGQQAQAPLQPIYALYPVEWRGDRQTVADEPAAEVEPLSIHDVWRVVNLMARMARDAAPDKAAHDRQVALRSDLLLYGNCYVDALTGERVPPEDVIVRLVGGAPYDAVDQTGREVLDASALAGATTHVNAQADVDAQWEYIKQTRLEPALAEITRDLQADGVLANDVHLTLETEPVLSPR